MIKVATLNVSNLVENKGQIEGVPSNPRTISEVDFEKMKRSIIEDPEFLQARELLVVPYKNKFVVIGGNMRLKAVKELGWSHVPCKIMEFDSQDDEATKTMRLRLLKDNGSYGSHNFDELTANFDDNEIWASGIWVPEMDVPEEEELEVEPEAPTGQKLTVEHEDNKQLIELYIELQDKGFVCTLK